MSSSLSNNNEKPLKMKLNMRSLPCSGTNVLQHQLLLSLQARAVTRNWQGKKEEMGCQTRLRRVRAFFKTGLWCNYNGIWPSQWAGDETDASGKKCETQKLKDPYALGNSGAVFMMCLQQHISDAQQGCVEMDKSMRPSGERKSR